MASGALELGRGTGSKFVNIASINNSICCMVQVKILNYTYDKLYHTYERPKIAVQQQSVRAVF